MKLRRLATAAMITALVLLAAGAGRAATYTLVHDYGENGVHPWVPISSHSTLEYGIDYSGLPGGGAPVDYVSIQNEDVIDSHYPFTYFNHFDFMDHFDLRPYADLGRITLKIRHRDNGNDPGVLCVNGERWHFVATTRVIDNYYNDVDLYKCNDTNVEWLSRSDDGWVVDTFLIDPRDVQTDPYFQLFLQEETTPFFSSPDDLDEIKIDYASISFQARRVVPLPGALWLLGSGLLSLAVIRRRT